MLCVLRNDLSMLKWFRTKNSELCKMTPPGTMILHNYASFIWKFIMARRNKEYLWKMMHAGMMNRSSIM
jgi:hypothetical protein